jgi:hypothetical protein
MMVGSALCIASWATVARSVPENEMGRGPRPKNDRQSWLLSADVPQPVSIRGRTLFILTIDPKGSVQNCEIAISSGSNTLDEVVCRSLSARAKFHPAQDRAGVPITGYYHSGVFWRPTNSHNSLFVMELEFPLPHQPIPRSDPREWITAKDFPASVHYGGKAKVAINVGADGTVKSCDVIETSGTSELDGLTCRLITARVRFLPARDAQGRAVEGAFPSTVTWRR